MQLFLIILIATAIGVYIGKNPNKFIGEAKDLGRLFIYLIVVALLFVFFLGICALGIYFIYSVLTGKTQNLLWLGYLFIILIPFLFIWHVIVFVQKVWKYGWTKGLSEYKKWASSTEGKKEDTSDFSPATLKALWQKSMFLRVLVYFFGGGGLLSILLVIILKITRFI